MEEQNTTTDYVDYERRIFVELVTVTSLFSIAGNLAICYTILRYRTLLRKKSNLLLLHFSFASLIFEICFPTLYRLELFYWDLPLTAMCVAEEFTFTMKSLQIYFIILLTFYWYFEFYNPPRLIKYENTIIFYISLVYFLTLAMLVLHFEACLNNKEYQDISKFFLIIFLMAFSIFMLIMNVIHQIGKRIIGNNYKRRNVSFLITNLYMLTYLFILITTSTTGILIRNHFVFIMIGFVLASLNPVFNLVILYKFDTKFHVLLERLFKCKCDNYDCEQLEEPVVFRNEVNDNKY